MKIVDSFFVISSVVVAHHRRSGRRRPGWESLLSKTELP